MPMGLFAHKCKTAHRARRKLTVWVAVVAFIFQMLVPFGQALAFNADQGTEFQYICTVTGIKQIPIDESGDPIEPTDAAPCPFCFVHFTPALFVPQQANIIILHEPIEHTVFGLPIQQVPNSIWRSSLRPPRAPPLFI